MFSIFTFCNHVAYCDEITVVIDPGHGGEALGGNTEDRIERDIDLITAIAMKERLEQFDNINVYLTREDNDSKELTRKERLEMASDLSADFLFSLHYNMSANHTLYGSETWICASGENYAKGMSFASIEMEALKNLGLFDRGIKCRLSKDGGEYYGILKYSQEYEIPAVIIEHCHLDEDRDSGFWNEASYKNMGYIDADCVAKYFHLKSEALGIDYSNYDYDEYEIPSGTVIPDETQPEECSIALLSSSDSQADITINSYDNDNYIQYYNYSTDNGRTWSRLESWSDRNSKTMTFSVNLSERITKLVVRTYNKYDLYTQSDTLELPALPSVETVEDENIVQNSDADITYEEVNTQVYFQNETKSSDKYRLPLLIIITVYIFILILITINIIYEINYKRT